MTDTQWPRYMVFQQMEAGDVFVHNGTVHAPDAEMALLNARDVFARRPQANAMWVVPVEVIATRTREQLDEHGWPEDVDLAETQRDFHIFGKLSQQGQLTQLGRCSASGPFAAMKQFSESYEGEAVWVWWAFTATQALSSLADDVDSLFVPFEAHTFKNQADYPVITMMRQIKSKGRLDDE